MASFAKLEAFGVLVDLFKQIFLIINYPLLPLEITQKLVIIVPIALPQIIIQLHLFLLRFGFLKVLFAILPEGVEVPLLDQGPIQIAIALDKVALLITIRAHFKQLLVHTEEMRLAVEASSLHARLIIVEFKRLIGLRVVLRVTFFKSYF